MDTQTSESEIKPTLFDKVNVLIEANGYSQLAQLPPHLQYFVFNVKGCRLLESISAEQYVAEHPDWIATIDADYAKVMADKAEKAKIAEAAKLAETEGVKFIAGLTPEQRVKLSKLLEADQPAAPAPAA